MSLKTALTESRIRELFTVDLESGEFFYKRRPFGGVLAGARAGYVAKNGYRIICIDYVDYFEHNLLWFLGTGELLPTKQFEVDHKNRIRHDNNPSNLRKATRSQNNANSGVRKNNRTGYKGVHFDKEKLKYCVQITKNKKPHFGGYFKNLDDAAKTAACMRKKLFGEFAHNG